MLFFFKMLTYLSTVLYDVYHRIFTKSGYYIIHLPTSGAKTVGQPIGEKHLQKIIPIRLSQENWKQIKKEADRMGIGVSTLTRIWIMDDIQKLAKQAISGKK